MAIKLTVKIEFTNSRSHPLKKNLTLPDNKKSPKTPGKCIKISKNPKKWYPFKKF